MLNKEVTFFRKSHPQTHAGNASLATIDLGKLFLHAEHRTASNEWDGYSHRAFDCFQSSSCSWPATHKERRRGQRPRHHGQVPVTKNCGG